MPPKLTDKSRSSNRQVILPNFRVNNIQKNPDHPDLRPNQLMTCSNGTRWMVIDFTTVYMQDLGINYKLPVGFFASASHPDFRFGVFDIEETASGNKLPIPGGLVYGYSSPLSSVFTQEMRQLYIENYTEGAELIETFMVSWPEQEDASFFSAFHFEHTFFDTSITIFKILASEGDLDLTWMGDPKEAGAERIKYGADNNNQCIVVTNEVGKGESYTVSELGYCYFSGCYVNGKMQGPGVEFKVSRNASETEKLSWLEGNWENGIRHGDFTKRELEKTTQLRYEQGEAVGVARISYVNGTQGLSQSFNENPLSQMYLLHFNPENSALSTTINDQTVSLSAFIQKLYEKHGHEFIKKSFHLMPFSIAQEVCQELARLGESPVHYFWQEMGFFYPMLPLKYKVSETWSESKIKLFVHNALFNLASFPRNALIDRLEAMLAFSNEMNVVEMEVFSKQFPMYPFTRSSAKHLFAARQTFNDHVYEAFAWMLMRLELVYGVMPHPEGLNTTHPMLIELRALCSHGESQGQRTLLSKNVQELELVYTHERRAIEEAERFSRGTELIPFRETIDLLGIIERRDKEVLRWQQQEASRQVEEQRRKDAKRQRLSQRQQRHDRESPRQQITDEITALEKEEAGDRHALEVESLQHNETFGRETIRLNVSYSRELLAYSFFAEKDRLIKQALKHSVLSAIKIKAWLYPENILHTMEKVAGIAPETSKHILFLMVLQRLPELSQGVYTPPQVNAELREAKCTFDARLALVQSHVMKKQWWGLLDKSAETYINLSRPSVAHSA